MPQLVTIKTVSDKDDRLVGEVLWVYPDDKKFTEKELAEYNIETVSEETAGKFIAELQKVKLEVAYKATTTDWTLSRPAAVEVWDNNGEWCEVKEKSYRPVIYKDGAFAISVGVKEANKTVLIAKAKP